MFNYDTLLFNFYIISRKNIFFFIREYLKPVQPGVGSSGVTETLQSPDVVVIQLLEHYLLLHLPHLIYIGAMTRTNMHPHLDQSLEMVAEMRIIVMWLRWLHFMELDV